MDQKDCPFLHIVDKKAGVSRTCEKKGCKNRTHPGYQMCSSCYHKTKDDPNQEQSTSEEETQEIAEAKENEHFRVKPLSPAKKIADAKESGHIRVKPLSPAKKIVDAKESLSPAKKVAEVKENEHSFFTASADPSLLRRETNKETKKETKNWGDIEDEEMELETSPFASPTTNEARIEGKTEVKTEAKSEVKTEAKIGAKIGAKTFVSAKVPLSKMETRLRDEKSRARESEGYTTVQKKSKGRTLRRPRVISCCKKVGDPGNPVYLRLEYCQHCLETKEKSVMGDNYVKIYRCRGEGCNNLTPMNRCTKCQ